MDCIYKLCTSTCPNSMFQVLDSTKGVPVHLHDNDIAASEAAGGLAALNVPAMNEYREKSNA